MGKFDAETVTWIPAHYSSERMKALIFSELSRRDIKTVRKSGTAT